MASADDKSMVSSNHSVSRSAFRVMIGGLFTLFAGLASQVVVAALFGTGAEMDAYLTALVVPAYLQAVLLAGLPFVFIPAFVQEQATGNEEKAWALAGTFFWLTVAVLTGIALGGAMFANQIIALSAPGLSPEKAGLAAGMLRILMLSVPLTGTGILTSGIQNARNRFLWPAGAGALGSVGNVVALLILYGTVGPLALAWGYLVSEVLRAFVTIVPVLRHGWERLMPLRDHRVREMARLMAPLIFFGIVTRSTLLFERFFASGLPDGDLSYLGYAQKVAKMMTAVLGAGITTAIFPAMARAFTKDGAKGLVGQVDYGLRLTLAVGLPTLAILSALAEPLVEVLFERGAFEYASTVSVARIIPIIILGAVVFQMVGNLLSRIYYVTKDTRTVPIVAALTSVLYIFLARWLAGGWGYVGLSLAQPLYSGLAIGILLLLLGKKLPALGTRALLKDTLLYGTASLVAFLGAWLAASVTASLPALVQLLAGLSVAGSLYIAIMYWIDRDIAISILEMTGVQRLVIASKKGFYRFPGMLPRRRGRYSAGTYRMREENDGNFFLLLLAAALITDLLTPFLIWKGILPAPSRWISHAAVAALMLGVLGRMLVHDRVPPVVILVGVISISGVTFALLQGQAITPTLWGWWILFQYPFIGLFCYLQSEWPGRFAQRLRFLLMALLTLQVIVQIGQYLTGEPVGDHLAGTFGPFGTAKLAIFVLFVLCLALGQWLASRQWKTLVWVLGLAGIASVLGEMKIFPFAAVALGLLTMAIVILRGSRRLRLVPYAILFAVVVWAFFGLYGSIVLEQRASRPLEAYFELDTLEQYLGGATSYVSDGKVLYDIGRNYALAYGWNAIRTDAATLLVGLGLGARGESRTLGTSGVGLRQGSLGLSTGTSLLVMLQELGVFGLLALGGFILWAIVALIKGIRNDPESGATELRYGLLLFSLLWPLWLWYGTVWTFRVTMLLYWMALGYVLGESHRQRVAAEQPELDTLSLQHSTR